MQLLLVIVAPRTVLGGFNLPVIPTSQKHLCKQFLRDRSISGNGSQGQESVAGEEEEATTTLRC